MGRGLGDPFPSHAPGGFFLIRDARSQAKVRTRQRQKIGDPLAMLLESSFQLGTSVVKRKSELDSGKKYISSLSPVTRRGQRTSDTVIALIMIGSTFLPMTK